MPEGHDSAYRRDGLQALLGTAGSVEETKILPIKQRRSSRNTHMFMDQRKESTVQVTRDPDGTWVLVW